MSRYDWGAITLLFVFFVWMWIKHPPVWEHNRRAKKKRGAEEGED